MNAEHVQSVEEDGQGTTRDHHHSQQQQRQGSAYMIAN